MTSGDPTANIGRPCDEPPRPTLPDGRRATRAYCSSPYRWAGMLIASATVLVVALMLLGTVSMPVSEHAPLTSASASTSHSSPAGAAVSGGLPSEVHLAGEGPSIAPPISAQPSPSQIFYGWVGWDGNRSIYPSMDQNPTYLSSLFNESLHWQTSSNSSQSLGIANSMMVSVATGPKMSSYSYTAGGVGTGFNIYLDFTGLGTGSTIYSSGYPWGVYDVNLSEALQGFPTATKNDLLTAYDTGVNMSTGNQGNSGSSGDELVSALSLGIDIASVVYPPAGLVLGPASILLDLISLSGEEGASLISNSLGATGGNTTVNQWSGLDVASTGAAPYDAAYAETNLAQTTIPLLSGGYLPHIGYGTTALTVYACNSLGTNTQDGSAWGWPFTIGSCAQERYPVWPDVSIGGTVTEYPHGPAAGGAVLDLLQDCSGTYTEFVETTTATGYWHFFADPYCSYTYNASASNPDGHGTVTTPSVAVSSNMVSVANEGNNTTLPKTYLGYWTNFTESGLPSGDSWGVEIGSTTISSTGSTISFLEPNGTYSYTVNVPSGYSASPPSGSVTVNGASPSPTAITIQYAQYSATFTESGLYSGTSWSVTFHGSTSSSTGTSIGFYDLTDGTYSFSVGSVSGYSVSPSSGQVTINGASASESIKFTATSSYTVSFSETGVSSSYSWGTEIGDNEQNAAGGTGITFTGVTGTDGYTVFDVVVSSNACVTTYYAPSPGSGTVSGATHISVTYTEKTIVNSIVNRCVLAPASLFAGDTPGAPTAARAASAPIAPVPGPVFAAVPVRRSVIP